MMDDDDDDDDNNNNNECGVVDRRSTEGTEVLGKNLPQWDFSTTDPT
jgi:hypothetical protein